MKRIGKRIVNSFILSFVIIFVLIMVTKSNIFLTNTVGLWFISGIYLFIFYSTITLGWSIKKLDEIKIKKLWLRGISLSISIILLIVLPIVLPCKYGEVLTSNYVEKMRYENHKVTLNIEERANSASGGKEVVISSVKLNKLDYNIYEIPLDNIDWYFNEGRIYCEGNNHTELVINFEKGNIFDLRFQMTPNGGIVKISDGKYKYNLDLYSKENKEVNIDWQELYGAIIEAPELNRIIYYVIFLFLIWTFIDAGVIFVLVKHMEKKKMENI